MALGDETPTTGRHRRPSRPNTRVEKDSSIDIAQSFDVFTTEIRALNATMNNMRNDLQANLDAQARFSVDPSKQQGLRETRDRVRADRPSEGYDVLAGIVQDAMASQNWEAYNRRMGNDQVRGASAGPSFRYAVDSRAPISGTSAMQSVGHFQAWAAQRIGQKITGPDRDPLHPSLNAPMRHSAQRRGSHSAPPSDPTAGQTQSAPEGYQPRHERPEYSPRHARPEEEEQDTIGMGTQAAIAGRLGSALAQSGGTSAGLGAALKRVPYVGIAVEAVSRGRDFYLDQREQARGYQEMTGSTGWQGWGDARREDLHALTNIFKYSGDRARDQFQTATALGFNDQRETITGARGTRREALDFMDDVYHNAGMDTDEAGAVLDVASRNSQTNLNRLATTLERLSESAGKAGINAMKARENFLQAFEFTSQRGYGPAAVGAAEIMTQSQIAYGKTFEDTDMSGLVNESTMMMVAGNQGMAWGDVQGQLRNNEAAYFGNVGEMIGTQMRNMKPNVVGGIESAVEGEDISNPNVRNRIKDELFGEGGEFEGEDMETFARVMSEMLGVPISREQAIDFAVTEFGGGGLGEQSRQHEERAAALEPGSVKDVTGRGGSSVAQEAMENDKVLGDMSPEERAAYLEENWNETGLSSEANTVSRYNRNLLRGMNAYTLTTKGNGLDNQTVEELSALGKAYADEYLSKGQQDPFLEELISNLDGVDPEVEITTSDGQSQVMTLSQAIKAGHGDLIATGNVRFVQEEFGGQTTADIAGVPGRDGPEAANQSQEELTRGEFGRPMDEWAEDYKGNPYGGFSGGSQTTAGGVTIGLAPDAQRLFQILDSDPNGAAAAGSPINMGDLDSSRYPSQQPN